MGRRMKRYTLHDLAATVAFKDAKPRPFWLCPHQEVFVYVRTTVRDRFVHVDIDIRPMTNRDRLKVIEGGKVGKVQQERMKDDEICLDCEAAIKDPDFGHGGDPIEPYEEGFHLCGKKNPRVVKKEKTR